MTELKATKGPWHGDGEPVAVRTGPMITIYREDGTVIGYAHAREDAHLMAGAPELYDALERLLAFVVAHTESGEVIPPHTVEHERTRAALAKARGEQ